MVSNVIPLRLKGWTLKQVTDELKKCGYAMPLEAAVFIMNEVAGLSPEKPISTERILITPKGNIQLLQAEVAGEDNSPIVSWGVVTWELLTFKTWVLGAGTRKPSYFNPKVDRLVDSFVMSALSNKTKAFSIIHIELSKYISDQFPNFDARVLSEMLQRLFEEKSQTVAG